LPRQVKNEKSRTPWEDPLWARRKFGNRSKSFPAILPLNRDQSAVPYGHWAHVDTRKSTGLNWQLTPPSREITLRFSASQYRRTLILRDAAGGWFMRTTWCALYGFLLVSIALSAYVVGVALAPVRWLFADPPMFRQINAAIVWYSGVPLVLGSMLIAWDLFRHVQQLRHTKTIRNAPPANKYLTVALTAYNDELSIRGAVEDFKAHPLVRRVIVISNNSADRTMEIATEAGAIVFNEPRQGYGSCVHRALAEALKFEDTEMTVLCEGDLTFRAADLEKMLAYIPHADVVNGSRIVEQLQARDTQLSMYMHYGNLFAGKVLELKHLGSVSLTDVGTTYKLCRNGALRELMNLLDPRINLEFNAYFLDRALESGVRILECPITFHPRVGTSKGGNVNNRIATRLGLRMLWGIFIDWKGFGDD
jgi:hypothetical protein